MKKILSLLLLVIAILNICACNNNPNNKIDATLNDEAASAPDDFYNTYDNTDIIESGADNQVTDLSENADLKTEQITNEKPKETDLFNEKKACISEYLYGFSVSIFEKWYSHIYSEYTLVDCTDDWYMISFCVNEFEQPNSRGFSKIHEVYAGFYVEDCIFLQSDSASVQIIDIKYDKTLGLEGLFYATRFPEIDGPVTDKYIEELKQQIGWGTDRKKENITSEEIVLLGKISKESFILDRTTYVLMGDKIEAINKVIFDDYYLYPMAIDVFPREQYYEQTFLLKGKLSKKYDGDPDVFFSEVSFADPENDKMYEFDITRFTTELNGFVEEYTVDPGGGLAPLKAYYLKLGKETELTDVNGITKSVDQVELVKGSRKFEGIYDVADYVGEEITVKGMLINYDYIADIHMVPECIELRDANDDLTYEGYFTTDLKGVWREIGDGEYFDYICFFDGLNVQTGTYCGYSGWKYDIIEIKYNGDGSMIFYLYTPSKYAYEEYYPEEYATITIYDNDDTIAVTYGDNKKYYYSFYANSFDEITAT